MHYFIEKKETYYHQRIKIFFIKKEHVRTLNSSKLSISHILSPLSHKYPHCVINNFAELQLLPLMEFSCNTLPC